MKSRFRALAAAIALGAIPLLPVGATVPRTIGFQSVLNNAGGVHVADGSYTVTFRVYDNPAGVFAVTGEAHGFASDTIVLGSKPLVANSETVTNVDGTVTYTRGTAYSVDYPSGVITRASATTIPNGTDVKVSYQYTAAKLWEETKTVTVAKGVLSTTLGGTTAFPASLLFDEPYWVGVQVGDDAEMTPRMPLGPVPYALSLSLPFAGRSSSLTAGLAVSNAGSGYGISGSGSSGVDGVATSPTGAGVYAQSAAGKDAYGLFGLSTDGMGVYSYGGSQGVFGTSPQGVGVFGTSSNGTGVYATSSNGTAVIGYSSKTKGVYGQSDGTTDAVGVYGDSANGYGMEAVSTNSSGLFGSSLYGNGVTAQTSSASAFAVYGTNHAQGPSVGAYYQPGANGVGLFAGDWGWFGSAAIETDLTGPGTHIFCAENGTGVFYVAAGGAVHALSYGNLSDARYKQNIHTVGNPLAKVAKLRGVSFEWNPGVGRSFPKGRQIGFVAQEVRKVLPELVSEDEKGYLSVEYANVVPVLVEAVKEQQREIKAQRAEVAVLRAELAEARAKAARVDDLGTRLERLERRTATGGR